MRRNILREKEKGRREGGRGSKEKGGRERGRTTPHLRSFLRALNFITFPFILFVWDKSGSREGKDITRKCKGKDVNYSARGVPALGVPLPGVSALGVAAPGVAAPARAATSAATCEDTSCSMGPSLASSASPCEFRRRSLSESTIGRRSAWRMRSAWRRRESRSTSRSASCSTYSSKRPSSSE